jgi:hypothetical protein
MHKTLELKISLERVKICYLVCQLKGKRVLTTSHCLLIIQDTVDSRYYDTDGIRKMYQYNHTIEITSLKFCCLGMVGIQIWYRNKQYFIIKEIVMSRVYCTND